MDTDQLVFDLVLETKKAVGDIKTMLSKTNAEASRSGKTAGTNFGSNFVNILQAYIAKVSFTSLITQVMGAYGAFKELKMAQIGLNSAIKSINASTQESNAILKSETATLEEKGYALGYNKDQMYETVKVQGSVKNSSEALEKQIRQSERAFEDETKALEGNVTALEDKRDLEIQSLREQKGFQQLSEEDKALKKELTQLELERLQAIKNGDTTQITNLDTIIKQKKLDQDIAQKKIDLIDLETDKIENLYEVQIKALRIELEAKKNRFDIDIEPAKRKLEDLKGAVAGGSSEITRMRADMVKKIQQEAELGLGIISEEDVNKAVNDLYNKYDKVISKRVLMGGFKNIFQRGLKDVGTATNLLDRYVNAAATGRSANVNLEDAVLNLSEAYKTGNSVLGNMSGISENFSFFQEKALDLYNRQHKASVASFDDLSKEEQALFLAQAQLEKTTDRKKGFTDALESGLLEEEKFNAETRRLKQTLGEELLPTINDVFKGLAEFIRGLTKFSKDNPSIVKNLVMFAVAITGIITALLGANAIFGLFAPLVKGIIAILPNLGVIMATITGPIGLVVLAVIALIAGLVLAYHKIDWFKQAVDDAFNKIKEIVLGVIKWFQSNMVPLFSKIFGDLGLIFQKLYEVAKPFINALLETIKNMVNNAKVYLEGIVGVVSGVISVIAGILSGDGDKIGQGFSRIFGGIEKIVKASLNNTIDLLNSFLSNFNNIGNVIEKATGGKINIADMPKIPKFAQGGSFVVGGQGGVDTNLVRFMATKGERVTIETQQQQINNSRNNSGNITYINYGSPYRSNAMLTFIRNY
jgi:hypothetical protein